MGSLAFLNGGVASAYVGGIKKCLSGEQMNDVLRAIGHTQVLAPWMTMAGLVVVGKSPECISASRGTVTVVLPPVAVGNAEARGLVSSAMVPASVDAQALA